MPYTTSEFFAGLDLGQSQDFTALAIAERITSHYTQKELYYFGVAQPPLPQYYIRYLERLKLGTPYPEQVRHVKALIERDPLKDKVKLALDFTGVGRPVCDMFREAQMPCFLIPVLIHGGNKVTNEGLQYNVPKRDLVSVTQVLLQSNRLQIAEALPEAATLVKEMLNFKVKIDPKTAHDSYEAWREGVHDDLVLSVALALWIAERGPTPPVVVKYVA